MSRNQGNLRGGGVGYEEEREDVDSRGGADANMGKRVADVGVREPGEPAMGDGRL